MIDVDCMACVAWTDDNGKPAREDEMNASGEGRDGITHAVVEARVGRFARLCSMSVEDGWWVEDKAVWITK